jgi:hypothetical protein
MRNVDSRNHSLRFDCCVFSFYSFYAVTFATISTQSGHQANFSPRRLAGLSNRFRTIQVYLKDLLFAGW